MTLNTKKAVPKDLIDSLLADYKKPEDLIGENGLLKQLTKLLVERALDAEMSEHLGHDKNAPVTNPGGNARNGKSKKTLKGEFGVISLFRLESVRFSPLFFPALVGSLLSLFRHACTSLGVNLLRVAFANRGSSNTYALNLFEVSIEPFSFPFCLRCST